MKKLVFMFVGAGGIGMSAIARYFLNKKLVVAGYDKYPFFLRKENKGSKEIIKLLNFC